MDLQFLQYTDAELVVLAGRISSKREARREIQRRKKVGAWRLIANYKLDTREPEADDEEVERVYAEGVTRRVT